MSPGNQSPTAGFGYTTSDLMVDFSDQSTDPDGSIVSWSWDFGDGVTSPDQSPVHTYAAGGTYSVTLTVTDDGGATDTTSQAVTVVPTLAPRTTQMPCLSVNKEALTRPTVMTVVALLD